MEYVVDPLDSEPIMKDITDSIKENNSSTQATEIVEDHVTEIVEDHEFEDFSYQRWIYSEKMLSIIPEEDRSIFASTEFRLSTMQNLCNYKKSVCPN